MIDFRMLKMVAIFFVLLIIPSFGCAAMMPLVGATHRYVEAKVNSGNECLLWKKP